VTGVPGHSRKTLIQTDPLPDTACDGRVGQADLVTTDPTRRYDTVVTVGARRRVMVPVPFDPDEVWGAKPEHHVAGTVNAMAVRAVVEPLDGGYGIVLGAAWRRDCGLVAGDKVTVELAPEGPQRSDLAADLQAALAAVPDAGAFFDSLAQFYRRAYLRWIDGTKGRPEVRAERIGEVVGLLKQNLKQRP